VTYIRNGVKNNTQVTLTKNEVSKVSQLGLELKNIDKPDLKKLKVENGVKVTSISNKELMSYGVKTGYIIVAINGQKVFSVDDVNEMISAKASNQVMRIEMLNLKGEMERYIFR